MELANLHEIGERLPGDRVDLERRLVELARVGDPEVGRAGFASPAREAMQRLLAETVPAA